MAYGTINVDTLTASTGVLATQNGMTGICKAWVNFNGTSGSIYKGFNVSSVTRTAAGFYTVNFTTAMPDANYAVVLGSMFGTNGTTVTSPSLQTYGGAPAQTTTALYVSNQGTGGGGGNADSQQFCVAVFD